MRYAVDSIYGTIEGLEEDGLVFDTYEEAEAKFKGLNGEDKGDNNMFYIMEYPSGRKIR